MDKLTAETYKCRWNICIYTDEQTPKTLTQRRLIKDADSDGICTLLSPILLPHIMSKLRSESKPLFGTNICQKSDALPK